MQLPLQLVEEVEDLGLDRDVEGADRLVGHDDLRLERQGPGDADALALPPGELVGVAVHRRGIEADALEERGRGLQGGPDILAVGDRAVGDGPPDAHPRVQRTVGILEDHLDPPPRLPQGLARQAGHVDAAEAHPSPVRVLEPHEAPPHRGLARSALADDAQGLAAAEGERDVAHRRDRPGRPEQAAAERVALGQTLDVEDRVPRRRPRRPAGPGLHVGDRGDQLGGIGVLRPLEDVRGAALLDDPAVLHHRHPVGDLGDHAEIVGDEHHRHAAPGLEIADQAQDLRLRGDVEGRGRLVGDQHLRFEGQRHGDHHALPLAARELERVRGGGARRVGQADLGQQFEGPAPARPGRQQAVRGEDLGDLRLDPHQRVEGRHRLLEDHRDAPPAHRVELRLVEGEQVGPAEEDPAADQPHRLRQKAHRGVGRHRLARAALADDAEDLAGPQREADPVDGVGAVRAGRQGDGELLDDEDRLAGGVVLGRVVSGGDGHGCAPHRVLRDRRGLRASFSPSPTRFRASTVRRIATPGKRLTHHACRITVRPAPMT